MISAIQAIQQLKPILGACCLYCQQLLHGGSILFRKIGKRAHFFVGECVHSKGGNRGVTGFWQLHWAPCLRPPGTLGLSGCSDPVAVTVLLTGAGWEPWSIPRCRNWATSCCSGGHQDPGQGWPASAELHGGYRVTCGGQEKLPNASS